MFAIKFILKIKILHWILWINKNLKWDLLGRSVTGVSLALLLFLSGCGPGPNLNKQLFGEDGENSTNPKDKTPPAAVQILSPSVYSYVSDQNSFILSGTCESEAAVKLSGAQDDSMTCVNNTFSFTVSKNTDGTYFYNLVQTDVAGNSSSTTAMVWTRNTAVPMPTIAIPAASPFYSNGSSLTISGNCVTGNTVFISGASNQNMVCSSSTYSFSLSNTVDGTNTLLVHQKNSSNQTSGSVQQVWVRDTVAPAAIVVTGPSTSVYGSSGNSILLEGSCESGANVALSGDSIQNINCSSSYFSFNISKTVDGTYNFNLNQTDSAGNVSTSKNFQWIRGNALIPTPVITTPSTSSFVSNTQSLIVSGTCVTGYQVNLSGSDAQSVLCAGSTFSMIINKSTDGNYNFDLKQKNTATNLESSAATINWTLDTVVPAVPTQVSPSVNPYYSATNLSISGVCETGANVQLTGDDSQSVVCASSNYNFNISESVDGTYNYSIHQTDVAGNSSSSSATQWIKDSAQPSAPTRTIPSTSVATTNSSSFLFSGSCITGLTVSLSGDVVSADVISPSGQLTQTCISSSYSFAIGKTIDGAYNFSVLQTSLAGISSSSISVQWVRDIIAPDTSLTSTPNHPQLGFAATFAFNSNDASAVFECQLDGSTYASCTSPVTYFSVSNGAHSFNVRAVDIAGNADSTVATYSWSQTNGNTVALYHFTSSSDLQDDGIFLSPYNNPLTNTGATLGATGKFSTGISLNGTSQYVSAPHSLTLEYLNTTMSAEAQIKMSALPTARSAVMSKNGSSGQMGWEFGVKKQGSAYRLYFIGSLDGTTTIEVTSSNMTTAERNALTTGFNHIAVTWDKGAIVFYLNGVSKGTGSIGTVGSSFLFNNSINFRVGQSNNANFFGGVVDEVRLSQLVRWSAGFSAPTLEYTAD